MTDKDRLILFKRIEITKDDLRELIEYGYDYTGEEIEFLVTRLGQINLLILDRFVEHNIRQYLVDEIDEILFEAFSTSEGITRRQYPDIFECYLDNLDEEEVIQTLLCDTGFCDRVMARYERYLEHSSHADAMNDAIEWVMGE